MSIDNLTATKIKEICATLLSAVDCDTEEPMQDVGSTEAPMRDIDNFAIGKLVVVRTLSAGVWCGTLAMRSKNEVVLTHARRMWRWWCKESISLSGVVTYGIDQSKSKIAPPVNNVWLEAIEIMEIKGNAAKSIMEAESVQAM